MFSSWRFPLAIDFDYKPYCTPAQLKVLSEVDKLGSINGAAKSLNLNRSGIQKTIKSVRKRAALAGAITLQGLSPAPAPFLLKGESLLHNKRTGEDLLVWRKTKLDDAHRWEMIKEAIQEACSEVPPLPRSKKPNTGSKELLTLYPVADLHLAMRSSKTETGDDWNLEIAEKTFVSCFEYLIENSPPASVGFFANVGDLLHFDGLLPVTPKSRHVLDASSSYGDAIKVAIRATRRIVAKMLEKHDKVILGWSQGNHDEASSIVLMNLFSVLYEKEPRVEVINSDRPYTAYKFGKCMIAMHHSHLSPMEKLDRVFASMFPQMWGETTLRVCITGDKHHLKTLDAFGMTILQQPTLAGMDAYAAKLGFRSTREANAYTFHIDGYRVSSLTVSPDMFN